MATFTDSDASDPADTAASDTATIDGGDGSSTAGVITSLGGGQYSVTGSHTYPDEGTPTVTVSITDPDDPGGPATASATATVTDAALTAAGSPDFVSTNPIGGTHATFTDANPGATTSDFTSGTGSTTIDWGDGRRAGACPRRPGTAASLRPRLRPGTTRGLRRSRPGARLDMGPSRGAATGPRARHGKTRPGAGQGYGPPAPYQATHLTGMARPAQAR